MGKDSAAVFALDRGALANPSDVSLSLKLSDVRGRIIEKKVQRERRERKMCAKVEKLLASNDEQKRAAARQVVEAALHRYPDSAILADLAEKCSAGARSKHTSQTNATGRDAQTKGPPSHHKPTAELVQGSSPHAFPVHTQIEDTSNNCISPSDEDSNVWTVASRRRMKSQHSNSKTSYNEASSVSNNTNNYGGNYISITSNNISNINRIIVSSSSGSSSSSSSSSCVATNDNSCFAMNDVPGTLCSSNINHSSNSDGATDKTGIRALSRF